MRLLLGTGVLIASTCALAGEWSQSVSLPATIEHDSNLLLSSTDKQGVTRAIMTPTYNLVGTFGVDEITAGLGLRVERSSDQVISMNREDPNALLAWRRQTETGEFRLTAKYDQVSSRLSQLEETGLLVTDSTRATWSLGGNSRSAISALSTLTTNAEYKNVSYDAGNLTNYENLSAGVTWSYAWSERIEPFVQVTVSHYEPDRITVPSSDYYTLQGGVKLKLAENWDWSVQGGMGRVVSRESDNGWLASSTLRYVASLYDLKLDVGRSVSPSGEGGFVQSDRIVGSWSYSYDALSRLGLSASWQENQGLQPNTMQQFNAWASHELSPFWNARLYYLHRLRSQDGRPDASGDVLGVTLVYSHPDF